MRVPGFAWLRNMHPSRALRPAEEWVPPSWPVAAALLVALYVAWAVVAHYRSPLRQYPGPFLAKWTNLWRFYHTLRGDIHLVNLRTHARYGPVVRTGPNHLELDRPDLIRTLYGADGARYRKTDFYPPASNVVAGRVVYNLFSLVDPAEHARAKRPVAKLYSLASILQLEGRIDETLRLLCCQLEARFLGEEDGAYGPAFDLGLWIKMYAWDVIGQITFSKRFGYLEAGRDFDGRLRLADLGSDYLASASQLPWLDRWVDKNPVCPVGGATILLKPTLQYVEDRYRDLDGGGGRSDGGGGGDGKAAAATAKNDDDDDKDKDFLDRFLRAKRDHPDVVDDHRVLSYLAINMLAGADTTAITIKAVLYYVLRTPRVRARLEADLVLAVPGRNHDDPPAFAAVRPLPYLEAVVLEAMRLHPGVAMTLPRYVPDPAEGTPPLVVGPDGAPVPPGTSVGMNPFVLGRNRGVWGADADVFRPERWLRGAGETEAAFAARRRAMHAADLTFGAGARVCLGRHLALVEVYKVVAALFLRYDFDMVDPDKEWWVRNGFFLRQQGPRVRTRLRV